MPDAHFADPRLAALYDVFDDDRSDLDHYVRLVAERGARSILDVGCGTGSLACLLADSRLEVIGVDPADASLEVARRKRAADKVAWIHGTTADLPCLSVDLALMTGNVAQVFLSDDEWVETLRHVHAALASDGAFVFETRVPSRRGWEEWTPALTCRRVRIDGQGEVEYHVELDEVALPFVSFRSVYRFAASGVVLTSDSTLRFRELDELGETLAAAGFAIEDVREAPDRPGREYVVIAHAVV